MKLLKVAVDGKNLRITNIPPFLAGSLLRLGEILAQRDHPDVRGRIFPTPTDDAGINEDWSAYVGPELRHLFVSAGETVTRDLASLQPDSTAPAGQRLTIPVAHRDAWFSAINEARLILGERFGVTEKDMDRGDLDPDVPKDVALAQIHVLAWLLELLVASTRKE